MHTRMMQWSRLFYLAGIVLALVAVVPTAWFPFALTKVAAFAVCLGLSAILFVAGGGAREFLRSHGLWWALLVLVLPLAYLLSMAFSTDPSVALAGYGVEVDTVLFTSLAALAFLFAFVHFKTLRTVRGFLQVLFFALVAAAVFQLVSIVFGQNAIPLATFADRSVNLVGKWNDLGILIGLLLVQMLVSLECMNIGRVVQGAYLALGVVLLGLLALINFPLVWGLLLACSLAAGLMAFLATRADRGESGTWSARMPWYASVVAGVSIAFLIYGGAINLGLTAFFPVSSLEVRPSYETTNEVISDARAGSIKRWLVGTGPNTFGHLWLAQKPAEVNQSQFWDLDFLVGFSTLTTALGTVGLVGTLAWFVPLLLVLGVSLRVLARSLLTREDRAVAILLVLGSVFLFMSLVLYVPSANIALLTMALMGATFGFFARQGQSAAGEVGLSRVRYLLGLVLALVLMGASIVAAVAVARRLVAEIFVGQGSAALAAGNLDSARSNAARALATEETSNALRFSLLADSNKLAALAQATSSNQSELQKEFADVLQHALAVGQQAQTKHPQDYRPVLLLAQIYDFLSGLKVDGAAPQARATYAQAAALNPTNPHIALLHARFEANQGGGEEMQKQLNRALTLKSNYTDAMLFVTQLAVANNDINTAVQAAQAAVQSAPGISSLWFQLGLLLYSGGDTKDAIPVLEQALILTPDYANAQYFLGLSYWRENRQVEAAALFEALAKTNPDNNEVTRILANMRAGKDPFDGATPPENTPPQTRPTAPVAQ